MRDQTADMPWQPGHRPARAAPEASRKGRHHEPRHFAALDLGTNNCRLLIARPQANGFAVVDAFSRIVRLGEGLATTGQLSEAAIDRTIEALKICADKLRRRDVALARSVATEACRRASNGHILIERAYRETGIALDVISAEEEARLAVLGCHILIEPGDDPALVFDIGGGSTELVLVDTRATVPTVLDWHSAPWGVVSLTEHIGPTATDRERGQAYLRMREIVSQSFAPFALRLPKSLANPRLLGTSGTITTLASVHLGLERYDRQAVDGLIVPADAMRGICADLAGKSIADRALVPCIGNERADLVVAGCAILETIMDLWPAVRVGVADRGIREGILRRLISGAGK
ncbi:Ppx/GppA phosphatase family protein [Sphingomonas sp. GlSt437]|uniref:Ppx/GppA phosphatase family protein n=1 Tax=Sphingomonas sp. GlSt437 TaxID=3389970 RepID=UPI003A8595F4